MDAHPVVVGWRDTLSNQQRVLVVDDEKAVRSVIHVHLTRLNMQVDRAQNVAEALQLLSENPYDLVITDVRMPGEDGLALLEKTKSKWPDTPVIVMTGFGSVEDAVHALKLGATEYLLKPLGKEQLITVVEKALATQRLRDKVQVLEQQVEDRYGFENIVGNSEPMLALFQQISAVSDTSATVLLLGETGTGKELLAHAIHHRSSRKDNAFVRVNCAAIPENLIEAELFGYEKGAFTGAHERRIGRFERADGGSIFLDEIGEIDLMMQSKLLRVLESGELQRLGSSETRTVDVRIIAATNRDLAQAVRAGEFREDLYYRLNVVALRVPPLRERREDIPLLVHHLLQRLAKRDQREIPRVSPQLMETLSTMNWPGNVRELEHTLERSMVLSSNLPELHLFGSAEEAFSSQTPPELPAPTERSEVPSLPPEALDLPLPEALRSIERQLIIEALESNDGVQARAARDLGISRSNLAYRIQKLGITLSKVHYE